MPPALSDDESEPEVILPSRNRRRDSDEISESGRIKRLTSEEPAENGDAIEEDNEENEGEDDEEEGEDLEEDEFIVEAIKKHMIDAVDGTLKFQVKWEGYDSKKDLTWEPEENLAESATDILEEYLAKIGGREKIFEESEAATKSKKRGRASGKAESATKRSKRNDSHPASTEAPKSARQKAWVPPAGSWEDEIETIDACEDAATHKLVVYLNWKNGHKTKHDTHVIYKKCPQKMLQFYERHVKIVREETKVLVDEA